MGIVIAVIAAFIFLGGVSRIASITEKMVPLMAVFYIVGCLIILVINRDALLGAIQSIFVAAFDPQAILGGVAGITGRMCGAVCTGKRVGRIRLAERFARVAIQGKKMRRKCRAYGIFY